MTLSDRRGLDASAREILANTPNQKRLVLLWAGFAALLSLLTGLLSYVLDTGIAGTGGLSGIGLRSVLTTAQQVISTFTSIFLPFWSFGYLHATLRISRNQATGDGTLLEGFRRFGPGLRLMLLQGLLYGGLFTLCTYAAILLLAATPLANSAFEALAPVADQLATDPNFMPDAATAAALTKALLPLSVCGAIAAAFVVIPLFYRLRLASLRLMDDPRCGALQAMGTSLQITRGNAWKLFRLDLHFWWFWLLEAVILAITYGDTLLPKLGIALPVSPDVAFWAFYVVALIIQLIAYTALHNRISVTYALAYNSLLPKENGQLTTDN